MNLSVVPIEKPDDMNFILGHSHFIKTVEDIGEILVGTVPQVEYGLAFCEASGPCLIRKEGNDHELVEAAVRCARDVGAGHSFYLLLRKAYPINVLNATKRVPEVCTIFCATANNVQVVVVETEQGRGLLGVIDGARSAGVETPEDVEERKSFLRKIGYKL